MKKTFQHSLLLFLLSAQLGIADPNTWQGVTASMNSAGNWSAGIPSSGSMDGLLFPAGANSSFIYAVTNDLGAGFSVASIQITAASNSYTLGASGSSSFSIISGSTLTTTGAHTISMPIVLPGTWNIASSSSALTISGSISGSSGSIILTQGLLTLSGVSNSFGPISPLVGVTINGNATPAAILSVPTAVSLQTDVLNNGTLVFTPTTTETYNHIISGTGVVQMNGTGIWNLGGANTYSRTTNITQGTLGISNDGNLGTGTGTISLGGGTLLLNTGNTFTIPITLTGSGTLSTASTPTFSGIISESGTGSGILTISAGSSTLILGGAGITNTYSGGTVVSSGTLSIAQQSNIGTGNLTLATSSSIAGPTLPTLKITQPITSFSTPIILGGAAQIDISAGDVKIVKPITGSGLLKIVAGSSTLTLSSVGGASNYGGGTSILSGTVVGDTSSITGSYTLSNGSVLKFDQSTSGTLIPSGTFSGILTSSGTLPTTGTLQKVGTGTVILTGISGTTFTGPTTISGGTLHVTGSLGGTITVSSGGTLSGAETTSSGTVVSGSGTVNTVSIEAGSFIGPNGSNTLNITGTLGLTGTSTYAVEIAPAGVSDLLNVTGAATLNSAKLSVDPDAGFYGFGSTYTILQAGSIVGDFAAPTSTDSNFTFTTSKNADETKVYLHLTVIEPFLGFPGSNANTQSVANYFNALGAAGVLNSNAILVNVINSLAGQTDAQVNDALDQLHPAAFSAFWEVQADVGGHLISMFHRRPGTTSCQSSWRVWAEPYGNWLEEKSTGMQQGFLAQSYGGAMGIDGEIFQNFVIGLGGAYNHSNLTWKHNRGHAISNGYYGAAYADYTYKFLYFGGAILAGMDHYHTDRRIQFTTINETAVGSHDAFDLIAQFSTGMFFGPSACCLAPYLNVDYFLLQQDAFTETGAPGLNLSIQDVNSQTIRTEIGMGLQVKDTNYAQTMVLSPRVAIGWTMEAPIHRDKFTSAFQGESITFKVKGWDYTWQLFSFKVGMDFAYKCFTIGGEYIGEINGNDKFWGQQANANLSWHW